MLLVAAYCRVSTDRDSQMNSLENQKRFFEEYIKGHGDWKLKEVYYDEGISGTQTNRRIGFNRMMKDALNGKIHLILTKEVSRFARNTVDTLTCTRLLKEHNVGVIFTLDNIDTRACDGELRLTIMASLAQEESRKTSERVKWGQKRRMEQGVVFGRDLIGYWVRNGLLEINPDEIEVVKAVFHKYTNEKKGTTTIAKELLEEGLKPKRVKAWSHKVILRMLRNEKYVGDLCQKKTITPDFLTHKKKYNEGEEELVYMKDHHEGIIGRELWERTQMELERRKKNNRKGPHIQKYWCTGKIICGFCGCHYVSRTKRRKDGTTYYAWRCGEAAKHGKRKQCKDGSYVGCSNESVNELVLRKCLDACIVYVKEHKLLQITSETCEKVLEQIVIKGQQRLEFSLVDVPGCFLLHYRSGGKKETYTVQILSMEYLQTCAMPSSRY